MLFTLLAFAVALGLLITFHELGHSWVARRCGVRVLRFSIGFGRVLLQRTDRHGTQWALSAIPLGGYVKMLDEPPADANDQQTAEAFVSKSLWQRIAIVAAGPAANFVLAALLYAFLNVVGTHEPTAIIAQPASTTAAAHAGLQGGQHILSIDGRAVQSWSQVRWQLLDALTSGGQVTVTAASPGSPEQDYVVKLDAQQINPDGGDILAESGLKLATPPPVVTQVMDGGAGQKGGLQAGDTILAAGDVDTPTAQVLIQQISSQPSVPLPLRVQRDNAQVTLDVVPVADTDENGNTVGRIGVMLGADFPMTLVRYGVAEGMWRGIERTGTTAWFSLKMLGRMVVGDVSVRNISGPVTIADYAGQTARAGWIAYVGFLALISVSIGVLNLLPIPMLDGGHLMYYVIEAIRGRPLSVQAMEFTQRIGLALLAALMGIAFFNDFVRLFS